jgi:hypothetical protein
MCKMICAYIFPVETMIEHTNDIRKVRDTKKKILGTEKTYFTVDSISAIPVLLILFMDD